MKTNKSNEIQIFPKPRAEKAAIQKIATIHGKDKKLFQRPIQH